MSEPGDKGSASIPDAFNRPGKWAIRQIQIAERNLSAGTAIIAASPTTGGDVSTPPLYLQRNVLDTATAQAAIDMARWNLQNESVNASLVVDGDPFLLPQMIVPVPAGAIKAFGVAAPAWRIISVQHAIGGSAPYETMLNLALWQGLFRRVL